MNTDRSVLMRGIVPKVAERTRHSIDCTTALQDAIDAATIDGRPWLLALCWAALGLADGMQRPNAFERARRYAAAVEYPAFRQSIAQLTGGAIPDAWLTPRGLASDDSPAGRILVRLTRREVIVGDRKIVLARREAELLLALALHESPRDRGTLAAMIWPDLDHKSAGNAVSVYVKRLRRRFGNSDAVLSQPAGYRLRYPARVDVLLLEEAIAQRRLLEPLEPALEQIVASRHERLPQWVLTSDWLAPYARRFDSAVRRIRSARAAAAGLLRNVAVAQHYRTLLAAESDEAS